LVSLFPLDGHEKNFGDSPGQESIKNVYCVSNYPGRIFCLKTSSPTAKFVKGARFAKFLISCSYFARLGWGKVFSSATTFCVNSSQMPLKLAITEINSSHSSLVILFSSQAINFLSGQT